jgi:hypothetical protein
LKLSGVLKEEKQVTVYIIPVLYWHKELKCLEKLVWSRGNPSQYRSNRSDSKEGREGSSEQRNPIEGSSKSKKYNY